MTKCMKSDSVRTLASLAWGLFGNNFASESEITFPLGDRTTFMLSRPIVFHVLSCGAAATVSLG